jgi:hypothetical protein
MFVIRVQNTTSAELEISRKEVSFSPNPASESIHFQGLNSASEIRIFDLKGQMKYRFNFDEKFPSLINSLVSGIYVIRAFDNGIPVYCGKLVKE